MALNVFAVATLAILVTIQYVQDIQASPAPPLMEYPEDCQGKGYCFKKHEKYPQDVIDGLLTKKNLKLSNLKSTDYDIGDRDGNIREEDCDKNVTYEPIYEILDNNNETRIVVQSEQIFQQRIRVEECLKPGRITENTIHFKEETLKEHNLMCVEKRIDYKFLVLTTKWDNFEVVKSKTGIPVCCSCRLMGTSN